MLNSAVKRYMRAGDALASWLMRFPPDLALRLAWFLLLLEAIVVAVFVARNVMLYADGGWFVFTLAADNPWILKWESIAARATTYALTVWPVLKLSQWLDLTPTQITAANCLSFYGLQLILTAWSCWLAWRTDRRWLVFPITQTILFTLLGWGFPSELLLGPGILWIILLIAVRSSGPSPLFLLGFVALVFTHEMAVPAALVAGGLALQLRAANQGPDSHFWLSAAVMALAIFAVLWVRANGGGAGSEENMIYVFDPRRVLANPVLIPLVAGAWLLLGRGRNWRISMIVLCGLGFIVVLVAGLTTPLNFDAPRYGARTLLAVSMVTLAVVFAHAVRLREHPRDTTVAADHRLDSPSMGLARYLFLGLGVQAGSLAVFVHDWNLVMAAEDVRPAEAGVAPKVVDIPTARLSWTPQQSAASTRMQVEWSTPYRQYVLTDGKAPAVILYDPFIWHKYLGCDLADSILGPGSRFEASQYEPWQTFACLQPLPDEQDSRSKRLLRKVKQLLGL